MLSACVFTRWLSALLLFGCWSATTAEAHTDATPLTTPALVANVPPTVAASSIDHRRQLDGDANAEVAAAFVKRAVSFAVETINDDSAASTATLVDVVSHSVHPSVDDVSTFVPEYREQA